ncbi:MAG: hypothetical protein KJO21_01860 [Verrucomicrobiae bacterium]|nr:hypothetical protein [Verrucomicrobiae bacterium]NNJ42282.1 hypothetical protein [Akkermansiaceae bacterium]
MAEKQTWQHIARCTSRKINIGWWLHVLTTPLLVASLVIACTTLISRRELNTVPWLEIGAATCATLTLTGIICWFAARHHFESLQQSLVRIEAAMKLRNALTAADHGVAPWPEVPDHIHDGIRWQWRRLIPPIVGTIVIITCGITIPIHAKSDRLAPQQQPSAWNELDTQLDQLDQQEIVQEDYLDAMREKLEKLRAQSPNDWFSHSSLEATDHLKQSHQSEQENLKNNLQHAERSLDALQHKASSMNAAQKQRLLNQFDQAIQKMQQGQMKPNQELLKQLHNIDPKQLQKLTPEQLDQVRENMRQHAQRLQQNGDNPLDGEPGEDEWMDNDGLGEDGHEEDGQGGRGGIDRGPGHAPRPLGKSHDDTGAGKHEGLKSNDPRHALPGDLLETHDTQHDVDLTQRGPTAGGTTQGKGQGGERVWKNSLLPNEKKALKKFFE